MRNRRNYYRVLHVQHDAPAAVLKSSYRALMRSLEIHPDRGGDHWNAALINEAYAVLSDPDRRAAYDRTLGARPKGTGDPKGDSVDSRGTGSDADRPTVIQDASCVFCGSGRGAVGSTPDAAVCLECGSPMTLAGAPQLEASGRRAARRANRHGEILYYTDWPQASGASGRIINLSPGGLRFECGEPIALFQIVKIEGPLLHAVARVASCREINGRHTVGVQFYTVRFHSSRGTFLSTHA